MTLLYKVTSYLISKMDKLVQAKIRLRKEINSLKSGYTQDELFAMSEEVFSIVEISGVFQEANRIFIYNSLKDEVQTLAFMQRWISEKDFYLPVIKNDEIVFRKFICAEECRSSDLGISEPVGTDFTDYGKVDLIIVPGMAFDRKKNRMGRGKGYYDRFLPKLSAPKMGVCFDFQLLNQLPVDEKDVKMDYIVSENEFIW